MDLGCTPTAVDTARIPAAIVKVRESTAGIEETVRNSVERAATMAQNAAATIRSELQAIEGALLLTEVLSKRVGIGSNHDRQGARHHAARQRA
jgi:hypothetical protein